MKWYSHWTKGAGGYKYGIVAVDQSSKLVILRVRMDIRAKAVTKLWRNGCAELRPHPR